MSKPSPRQSGDCFGRKERSLAMTHSGQAYTAVSCPAIVMASVAKPSPYWAGDCFGRKERSLAMTPGGHQ